MAFLVLQFFMFSPVASGHAYGSTLRRQNGWLVRPRGLWRQVEPRCSVLCILLLDLIGVAVRYSRCLGLLFLEWCHHHEFLTAPCGHILLTLMALNLLDTARTVKLDARVLLGCLKRVGSNAAASFSLGRVARSQSASTCNAELWLHEWCHWFWSTHLAFFRSMNYSFFGMVSVGGKTLASKSYDFEKTKVLVTFIIMK